MDNNAHVCVEERMWWSKADALLWYQRLSQAERGIGKQSVRQVLNGLREELFGKEELNATSQMLERTSGEAELLLVPEVQPPRGDPEAEQRAETRYRDFQERQRARGRAAAQRQREIIRWVRENEPWRLEQMREELRQEQRGDA